MVYSVEYIFRQNDCNTYDMACAEQDPEKFKSRMHSLAYGQAMEAAARDYANVRTAPCNDPPTLSNQSADPAAAPATGDAW